MIQYNIRDLDAELGLFMEEMKQQRGRLREEFAVDGGDGVDPTGFLAFDHPSADHRRRRATRRSNRWAPQPGGGVAANIGEITAGPARRSGSAVVVRTSRRSWRTR